MYGSLVEKNLRIKHGVRMVRADHVRTIRLVRIIDAKHLRTTHDVRMACAKHALTVRLVRVNVDKRVLRIHPLWISCTDQWRKYVIITRRVQFRPVKSFCLTVTQCLV